MEQLLIRLERTLLPVLAFLLAVITIGVFIQVCMRYLLAVSFLWGEEFSLFAFIWCVFLGAAINVRRRLHFSLDLLGSSLRGRAAVLRSLYINLVILSVSVVMLIDGYRFAIMSIKRFSPALGITLLIPTSIIPLAAVYIALIALFFLATDVRRFVRGE